MRKLPLFVAILFLFPSLVRAQAFEKKTEIKMDFPMMNQPPKPAGPVLDAMAQDRKSLQEVGLSVDGPALLDYFKKRTYPEADPKEMADLIQKLGDEDFETREKSYERLLALGAGALFGIKEAEKNKDPEVNRRADEIRHRIEAKADPNIQAATARLIAKLKPAGSAAVLLNYLPFAADQEVTDEIGKTLGAIAVVGGKADPALVQALTDKVPIKRAVAGEACARARIAEQLPVVRKLWHDSDPSVRLRVALASVPLKEREIVPVLVDLLNYLNPDQLWPVEEVLVRLAGDKTPNVSLGTNDPTRKKCHDAWQAWLDKEGKTINLAKLEEPQVMLGFTLIVHQNINRVMAGGLRRPQVGEVQEIDIAKKVRWKFDVPTFPVDAQIVKVDGTDRVLIAEYQGGKISERDFKGEVKWEKNVGGPPIGVQRLPNGNTFVVMQSRLLEMDRDGKEIFSLNRPTHDIFRGRKVRNGDVIFITNNGTLTRVEGKTQKVLKSFHVGQIPILFGSIDVLPDGGVLVPDYHQNRVVEYNVDGKQMKTINVPLPNAVMRLPNGNTLVSSQNTNRVTEFDRNGTEVWSNNVLGMPCSARRR